MELTRTFSPSVSLPVTTSFGTSVNVIVITATWKAGGSGASLRISSATVASARRNLGLELRNRLNGQFCEWIHKTPPLKEKLVIRRNLL
jgi:hypothetical protein